MNLFNIISQFSETKILCIGDIMLDSFIYGDVSRISPEAPVPVLKINRTFKMLGGVGNVAQNIASLDGQATIISVIGNDDDGKHIQNIVDNNNKLSNKLVIDQDLITIRKSRYISDSHHLLRVDTEHDYHISDKITNKLIRYIKEEIQNHDIIVISDYNKGTINKKITKEIFRLAKQEKKKVLIDPKNNNYSIYNGAYIIKPNIKELSSISGLACNSEDSIIKALKLIKNKFKFDNILVTRSEQGMILINQTNHIKQFTTNCIEVHDVSGAGDTVLATLALCLAVYDDVSLAAEISKFTSSIVVTKTGTAAVSRSELIKKINNDKTKSKIVNLQSAIKEISKLKLKGKTIGFTNGCFDILHSGHIKLLSESKSMCDYLIVGLNSDLSIKSIKGSGRPINSCDERSAIIESLEMVDMIIIFDDKTPIKLIELISPDVLIKGSEYTVDQVIGSDFVLSYGGKIHLVELIDGKSTTNIIEKIKKNKK